MQTPWQIVSASQEQTDRLGQAIGRTLRGGETIALYGTLGTGKTALVRGIALGLGAKSAIVSSPTFVMIHEYQGRLPLAHVDLYRIQSPRDLASTGLTDYFAGSTVTAVEWANKAHGVLPPDRLEITLTHRTTHSRVIRLWATGPVSAGLLTDTRTRYRAMRVMRRRRARLTPRRKDRIRS